MFWVVYIVVMMVLFYLLFNRWFKHSKSNYLPDILECDYVDGEVNGDKEVALWYIPETSSHLVCKYEKGETVDYYHNVEDDYALWVFAEWCEELWVSI